VLDEDYFRLPDNPTFSDWYRHAHWKQKMYGGLLSLANYSRPR
jgi:hypothetical protein